MDDRTTSLRDDPHAEPREGSLFQSARKLKTIYAGASPHQLRKRIAHMERDCAAKRAQILILQRELKRSDGINKDVSELHARCVALERENKKLKADVERFTWAAPEPEAGHWVIAGEETPQVENRPVVKPAKAPATKPESVATFATAKDRF